MLRNEAGLPYFAEQLDAMPAAMTKKWDCRLL
jgi:hypothetical protein